MAGRSGVRSRRTRVYDCNYNMGESYYRSAIDKLDRKSTGRPAEPAEPSPALEDRYNRAFADEDLNSARRRAEKIISEESLFDSRGGKTARGRPLSTAVEEVDNEFDEEISNSLRRLRANKKKSIFLDDVDMETTVSTLQNRSRLGLADKIMESAGLSSTSELVERRKPQRSLDEQSSATVRWTAIDDSSATAVARARATRARLSDLEEETTAIAQRQAKRDRRAADLRAFMDENIERAF